MTGATPEEVQKIRERIVAACRKARELGFQIKPGNWGVSFRDSDGALEAEGDRCCPLGALAIADGMRDPSSYSPNIAAIVARALGVHPLWVGDFTDGFDGDVFRGRGVSSAYALGYSLREDLDRGRL